MRLPLAAEIIANQAFDFHKQDGITEIEEATQANAVEQRLNDALLAAEDRGEVTRGSSPLRKRRMNQWIEFPPSFARIALGCIDADFCK